MKVYIIIIMIIIAVVTYYIYKDIIELQAAYSIRYIEIMRRKNIRKILRLRIQIKKRIEQYFYKSFNRTWTDILDGLLIGQLGLIIFKIFYRVILSTNPSIYMNVIIFVLSFTIELWTLNIYKRLRKYAIEILKVLLGRNFWYIYDNDESFESPMRYNYTRYKIKDASYFNKLFQYFFIKSIQLQLLKLRFKYLFIFGNFLIMFTLLSNQYLVLVSIVSLLLFLSRLFILLADRNFINLMISIRVIDRLDNDEYIIPTWENALIMALWVTREFINSHWPVERSRERLKPENYNFTVAYSIAATSFECKYFQLFPREIQRIKYLSYKYHMEYGFRKLNTEEYGYPLYEIFTKRKNKRSWLWAVGGFKSTLSGEEFSKILLKPKNKKYEEIPVFKGDNIKSFQKEESKIEDPPVFKIHSNEKFITKLHLTHIRNAPVKGFLEKLPLHNNQGITQIGYGQKIENKEKFWTDIKQNKKDFHVIENPKDMRAISVYNDFTHVFSNYPELIRIYRLEKKNSLVNVKLSVERVEYLWMSPLASYEQKIEGLNIAQNIHRLFIASPYSNSLQISNYHKWQYHKMQIIKQQLEQYKDNLPNEYIMDNTTELMLYEAKFVYEKMNPYLTVTNGNGSLIHKNAIIPALCELYGHLSEELATLTHVYNCQTLSEKNGDIKNVINSAATTVDIVTKELIEFQVPGDVD